MEPKPQPRKYRLRIYREYEEVLTTREYLAVLDFSNGPQLRATEGVLDAYLQTLAYAAGARGDKVRDYHLDVVEWDDNSRVVCCWPAKSWPDRR